MNVSEKYSTLTLYDGTNYTDFTALAHIPLRPPNDYYTLFDVLSNGQSLDGSSVNILAIIKHVSDTLGVGYTSTPFTLSYSGGCSKAHDLSQWKVFEEV